MAELQRICIDGDCSTIYGYIAGDNISISGRVISSPNSLQKSQLTMSSAVSSLNKYGVDAAQLNPNYTGSYANGVKASFDAINARIDKLGTDVLLNRLSDPGETVTCAFDPTEYDLISARISDNADLMVGTWTDPTSRTDIRFSNAHITPANNCYLSYVQLSYLGNRQFQIRVVRLLILAADGTITFRDTQLLKIFGHRLSV